MRAPLRSARRGRRRTRSEPARPRPARYYLVAGLDLRSEMSRLCRLPALGGPNGRLATAPPTLTVRRARRRPRSRLGFAVPDAWRISVTTYPGIRRGDAEETLLHELVHLAVGSEPGGRRWHGQTFVRTLSRAMAEAYGLPEDPPPNCYHGAYATALEARRIGSRRWPPT